MATTRQKEAAGRNITKARDTKSGRAHGAKIPRQTRGLSTAAQNELPSTAFAFGRQRKEPLTDARHVRNAIARFDQVEDVSDADRDRAWKRITAAAKRFDVEISEGDWRDLFAPGREAKNSRGSSPKRSRGSSPKR